MKGLMLAAVFALVIGVGATNAQARSYRAPEHNYYQNNWMAKR